MLSYPFGTFGQVSKIPCTEAGVWIEIIARKSADTKTLRRNDIYIRKEVKEMETKGPICQSCGMMLQKDEDFGTKADGSKHEEYCHFCFKDGEFTDEGITMEQKIEKIVTIATTQMNIPEAQARDMANKIIPTLKRWKNN